MISIRVGGQDYSKLLSASVIWRLDALSKGFEITYASDGLGALPFLGGEPCQISVEGEAVLTGYIEDLNVTYSSDGYTLTASGRDRTADLIDSTLGPISNFKGDGLTLAQIIKIITDHLNLDIKIIDNYNPDAFNAAEDLGAPQPAENAFKFVEKWARKRQAILTSTRDGDILITQSSP